MRTRLIEALPWIMILGAAPAMMDCAIKNDAQGALSGCDEFSGGGEAVAKLDVDVKVKAFVEASAELQAVGESIKADVKLACVNMAKDLGETDTWSDDDSDTAISNDQKTGACDVVAAKIDAIMTAGDQAGADFGLAISGGECTVDVDTQASCETACQTDVTCTEGTVETRCTPGELTGQCDTTCKAEATCEGHADVAANCMGACEADCEGSCAGELRGKVEGGCDGMCEGKCDGVATPKGGIATCTGTCEGRCTMPHPTAMCHGKCAASCHGSCKGECKLEANAAVNCGASVNCKGGCTGTYTAPQCETEITPPVCTGDTNCQASCSAQASANAHCTGPSVTLFCNTDATADIATLKATIEANLPENHSRRENPGTARGARFAKSLRDRSGRRPGSGQSWRQSHRVRGYRGNRLGQGRCKLECIGQRERERQLELLGALLVVRTA